MKYQLLLFDEAARTNNPGLLNEQSVSELILRFKKEAFKISSEESLRLFIQNHQKALLTFNKSTLFSDTAGKILYLLESEFTGYLKPGLPISCIWQAQLEKEYESFTSDVVKRAEEVIPPVLYQILKRLLLPDNSLTVHQALYLNNFCKAWHEELVEPLHNERQLLYFLFKMNLNSIAFFNYVIDYTQKELYSYESLDVQIETIKMYLVEEAKYPDTPAYNTCLPGIKAQVRTWLKAEQKSLGNRHLKQVLSERKEAENLKLQTSISVAELVCLFKMLRTNGVIINKTDKEVYVAISRYFSTPKASSISQAAVYNKYYQDELPVKESVKSILLQTIRKT